MSAADASCSPAARLFPNATDPLIACSKPIEGIQPFQLLHTILASLLLVAAHALELP